MLPLNSHQLCNIFTISNLDVTNLSTSQVSWFALNGNDIVTVSLKHSRDKGLMT